MAKGGLHNKCLIIEFHFQVSWVGRAVECMWQKFGSLADVAVLRFTNCHAHWKRSLRKALATP